MQSAFFNYARKKWMLRVSIGALLLLLALSAACNNAPAPVVVGEKGTPTGRAMPRTSLPMPPTTTASSGGGATNAESFTLLDEQHVKLSDYLGKVVVLDFWATYCPPCRDEVPHLDELQTRYGKQGLLVIGLNVGGPEDRPRIPDFTESLKIKYMLGFPDQEMTDLYMGSDDRIPQTLVFDRKGRIVKHFVGYDQSVSVELERTIQKAVTSDE
jgi:thiol-disulfide isomerase/thioredoxin